MDIDPECNYCPTCHDEYRPEISTCAACGVALESGAALRARLDRQRTGRPEPIGPDEPLVLVRYEWFVDGKQDYDAITNAYTVKDTDVGQKIMVKVYIGVSVTPLTASVDVEAPVATE